MCFLCERVDGIDDYIIFVQPKTLGVFRIVNILDCSDFSFRVDAEQSFFQHLHFHLSHGLGGRHELSIHITDVHAIRVDDGEVFHPRSHQTLGTPTAHASHAKEDNADVVQALQRGIAHEQAWAMKYLLF